MSNTRHLKSRMPNLCVLGAGRPENPREKPLPDERVAAVVGHNQTLLRRIESAAQVSLVGRRLYLDAQVVREAVPELHLAATLVPKPESAPKFRAEDRLSATGKPIGRDFALTHNRKRPQKPNRKRLTSLRHLL